MKKILTTVCGSGLGREAAITLADCATKFALEAIGPSLNKELKDVNIPVILIEPGSYATGFNEKNVGKQFNWMKIDSYFKPNIRFLERKQFS